MECFILCLGCEIYGLIVIVSDIKGGFLVFGLGFMMVMGYELLAHFTVLNFVENVIFTVYKVD